MNFASKYVLNYDDSDEECVSEEEYEEGMRISDSGSSDEGEENPNQSEKVVRRRRSRSREREPRPVSTGHKLLHRLFGSRGGSSSSEARTSPPHISVQAAAEPVGVAPPPPPALPGLPGPPPALAPAPALPKRGKKKTGHWRKSHAPAATEAQQQHTGHRWRRADTNVVTLSFSKLTSPSNMHTGDPVHCSNCKAILSKLSKLVDQGEDKVWKCEFCEERNLVDVEPEEVPSDEDVTFMMQPAMSTTASGESGIDRSLIIFCMDTSGSMCVTTEVPGRVRLRGADRLAALQSLNEERESQWMPGQRRDVTYVSRLQGVQAAVDYQLGEMVKTHPNRRVALVAFNNEVTVIGDGQADPVTVTGDRLLSNEELVKTGSELPLPGCVKDTRKVLGDKVFDLEERGATALGPALLLSVAMAVQVPGSKVIICTDGMANVGLGSLENTEKSDKALEAASEFYTEVSGLATKNGVSVSVISIKGTDCRMVELGRVADETGGQVNIVDPLKLTQEFGSILAEPVIATNVSASFLIHKGLYLRYEDGDPSFIEKMIGNVTAGMEITFEYGVRKRPPKNERKVEKMETEPVMSENQMETDEAAGPSTSDGATAGPSGAGEGGERAVCSSINNLSELPFQLHIKYTDLDGGIALRVLTQTKPVTRDREVAEKDMNVEVIGLHTAQQSARFAEQGMYRNSRLNALLKQRLVSRASHSEPQQRAAYKHIYGNIADMENHLNCVQKMEVKSHGRAYSDDEEEEEVQHLMAEPSDPTGRSRSEACMPSTTAGKSGRGKSLSMVAARQRRKECSDDTAKFIYQAKSSNSKWLKKK